MFPARRLSQGGFLALTLIGVWVVRGNPERWCPLGGVEALPTLLSEGNVPCSLAITNLFILGGVLVATLLLKRAFCGYACPLGTIFEWTGRLGDRLGIRRVRVPRRLDAVLSLLPWVFLAVVLAFTWRVGELVLRGYDPCYALISRHGEDITMWAYVISGAVLLGSLVLKMPFCRWVCPFAAVMNPLSRAAPARITRDPDLCVECGECTAVCPMELQPDRVERLGRGACTSCLDCVGTCPEPGAIALLPPGRNRRAMSPALVAGLLILLLAAGAAAALVLDFPSFTWERGERPSATETVELHIEGLDCRGRANLLLFFLERRDDLEVEGYLRLEAWPGPAGGRAQIAFDPSLTDADGIRMAITSPDLEEMRMSPFVIEGFDPLGGLE